MRHACNLRNGGPAPATPGFNAVAPEWLLFYGAADAAPAVPAAESTLGSHPCVALSSAQVLPEWINRNLVGNAFTADGDYPLNFVSHSRGSLQYYPRRRRALRFSVIRARRVGSWLRRTRQLIRAARSVGVCGGDIESNPD